MKKSLLIAGAMLVLGASVASAQGGLNLSWNDCGTFGAATATFACNTNSGSNSLVASFIPPESLPEYLGLNSQIDIRTQGDMPLWWQHGSTSCRGTTGLAVNFDFTSNSNCVDFFVGQAAGGFVYERPLGPAPANERGRIRVTCAVPFDNRGPIDAGTEYYAYRVNFLRAKTTGTGSCAGCSTPACLVLDNIQLFQPPEQGNDPMITNPADRAHVTWQSSDPLCPASTPAANKTWGQVKSLYR
jgi:hypothetical protein